MCFLQHIKALSLEIARQSKGKAVADSGHDLSEDH